MKKGINHSADISNLNKVTELVVIHHGLTAALIPMIHPYDCVADFVEAALDKIIGEKSEKAGNDHISIGKRTDHGRP